MTARISIRHKEKTILNAKVYSSLLLLAKGLRFSKSLKRNQALLLASSKENLQTIDMLFVFFPIDALWLDKNKRVVYIARNIKPFTCAVTAPKKARYILECQANTTHAIKRNDKISFKIHQ